MRWIYENLLSVNKPVRFVSILFLSGLLTYGAYYFFMHPPAEKFVLGSDPHGYYQYLPAFFIQDHEQFQRLPWAKQFDEDKTLSVFTCGVALLQAPFFLLAHVASLVLKFETNGYSTLYYFSVLVACLFYVSVGLLFLFKFLIATFDYKPALFTVLLTLFATNLLIYSAIQPGMSHGYSFFLFSVYLYAVPQFYKNPTLKNSLFVALPLSLAVLIRPTAVIIVIWFILHNVLILSDLRDRLKFLVSKWYLLLLMFFIFLLVVSPQLIYWKSVTGSYLFYSYQDEGFIHWKAPQISTVLFGVRGGWFVYTPLMFVAAISLIILAWKNLYNSRAILLIMILIIYVNGSWWAPAFSASAGYRALVEYIPFMAVPLTFVIQQKNRIALKWVRKTANIALWVFVLYNIQFAFKYNPTLWWDNEWNWAVMLRLFQF